MNPVEKNSSLRLFFALWPDEPVRAALASWQPPLQALCGGSPMSVDTLHSTLVFLGAVEASRLEALLLAAQEVAGKPMQIEFDVARYWGHNHILYAAPQHVPAALVELQSELERRLRKHRFGFEAREFKPHVTLLRHSKWTDAPLPEGVRPAEAVSASSKSKMIRVMWSAWCTCRKCRSIMWPIASITMRSLSALQRQPNNSLETAAHFPL